MANGNRVIATGPAPPSRASMLGAAFGGGLQEAMSESIPRAMVIRRRARELNPLREAILQRAQNQGGQMNPAQAMLVAQAQDPVNFARMMENPQRLQSTAAVSQMLTPEQPESRTFTRVVSSDSDLNSRFWLGIPEGEHALVEFERTTEGIRPIGGVQGRFVTEGEGDRGAGAGGPFGSSRKGRAWNIMVDLAPGFAEGTLSEEEERTFHSAVAQVRERRTDPDTGLEIVPSVPDFVEDSYRTRRVPIPGVESDLVNRPGVDQPVSDQPGKNQAQTGSPPPRNEAESIQQLSQIAGEDPNEAVRDRQQTQQQYDTLPTDAQIPAWGEGRTIADEVLSGNVSGPTPSIARWLARVPGLGIRFPEQTSAKQTLSILRNRLVKALQTNPRFAVTERQSIIEDIDIDPSIMDNPQSFMDRLIGVDRQLASLQQEMEQVVSGNRATVSGESRQHAMDTLQTIRYVRGAFLPTRLETRDQVLDFMEDAESGTRFTAKESAVLGEEGDDNTWRIWSVD